jgi:hypothetical protein
MKSFRHATIVLALNNEILCEDCTVQFWYSVDVKVWSTTGNWPYAEVDEFDIDFCEKCREMVAHLEPTVAQLPCAVPDEEYDVIHARSFLLPRIEEGKKVERSRRIRETAIAEAEAIIYSAKAKDPERLKSYGFEHGPLNFLNPFVREERDQRFPDGRWISQRLVFTEEAKPYLDDLAARLAAGEITPEERERAELALRLGEDDGCFDELKAYWIEMLADGMRLYYRTDDGKSSDVTCPKCERSGVPLEERGAMRTVATVSKDGFFAAKCNRFWCSYYPFYFPEDHKESR